MLKLFKKKCYNDLKIDNELYRQGNYIIIHVYYIIYSISFFFSL